MRLNTFRVIFLLMSAFSHQFQEKYAMWHKKKKIGNVQSMLEQVLTYYCIDWIIFGVSYGNLIKKDIFE